MAAEDDTLRDAIRTNAAGPKRLRGDEGEIEQHSIEDQIEADRYLRNTTAVAKPSRGLRFSRMSPPGTT